jgi:hypothetical protein
MTVRASVHSLSDLYTSVPGLLACGPGGARTQKSAIVPLRGRFLDLHSISLSDKLPVPWRTRANQYSASPSRSS